MRRRSQYAISIALIAGLLLGAQSDHGPRNTGAGIVPTGFWVLNRERSRQLEPADQTLWIVKDDGNQLIWVSVSTHADRRVTLNTWDGRYDGSLTPVSNSGMKSRVTSRKPGTLHNEGDIAGVGTYSEDCVVMSQGRRFLCHGEVNSPQSGTHVWTDDFDWLAPGPR